MPPSPNLSDYSDPQLNPNWADPKPNNVFEVARYIQSKMQPLGTVYGGAFAANAFLDHISETMNEQDQQLLLSELLVSDYMSSNAKNCGLDEAKASQIMRHNQQVAKYLAQRMLGDYLYVIGKDPVSNKQIQEATREQLLDNFISRVENYIDKKLGETQVESLVDDIVNLPSPMIESFYNVYDVVKNSESNPKEQKKLLEQAARNLLFGIVGKLASDHLKAKHKLVEAMAELDLTQKDASTNFQKKINSEGLVQSGDLITAVIKVLVERLEKQPKPGWLDTSKLSDELFNSIPRACDATKEIHDVSKMVDISNFMIIENITKERRGEQSPVRKAELKSLEDDCFSLKDAGYDLQSLNEELIKDNSAMMHRVRQQVEKVKDPAEQAQHRKLLENMAKAHQQNQSVRNAYIITTMQNKIDTLSENIETIENKNISQQPDSVPIGFSGQFKQAVKSVTKTDKPTKLNKRAVLQAILDECKVQASSGMINFEEAKNNVKQFYDKNAFQKATSSPRARSTKNMLAELKMISKEGLKKFPAQSQSQSPSQSPPAERMKTGKPQ